MKRRLLCFLLLLIVSSAARAQVTAVRAGRLIDPETGTAAQNQVILVEKDKIKAVGPDVKIPSGAAVIDLSRATVMPGLFDAHTHLCMSVNMKRDRGSYYYTTLNDPDTFRAVQGVVNARTMLESGFTTVRDVGNEGNYACVSVRRAIEQGLIPGPTMLTAGRIIAPFGGQFTVRPDKRGLAEPEYFFADTRDELRKAVRENAHFGARLIKLVVDDQPYIYSVEDIRFVIEEARLMGMKVAAHCWTQAGAHNAAEAGVASIEHANGISDEDLAVAKRNGVVMAFTPFPEWMLKEFRSDKEEALKEYRGVMDRLGAAYRLGVPIAFATDAILDLPQYTRGSQSLTWLESYTAAGMPPREILKAMTTNAARLLGVEAERGAVRPGLFADLIATPDNPLEKIDALKRVSFVMKNGSVVKHERR